MLSFLLLVVAGVTAIACITAVACVTVSCIPAVAGIPDVAGVPLMPDVLAFVGLPAIAAISLVVGVPAIAFLPYFSSCFYVLYCMRHIILSNYRLQRCYRTVRIFCYRTTGISYSRKYRDIVYRIKSSIYRTIGYRTHKKLNYRLPSSETVRYAQCTQQMLYVPHALMQCTV